MLLVYLEENSEEFDHASFPRVEKVSLPSPLLQARASVGRRGERGHVGWGELGAAAGEKVTVPDSLGPPVPSELLVGTAFSCPAPNERRALSRETWPLSRVSRETAHVCLSPVAFGALVVWREPQSYM